MAPIAGLNWPPEPLFAAERTYAAWVRTGLAALASGVGAKKLLEG
jgi:putative membrane protein